MGSPVKWDHTKRHKPKKGDTLFTEMFEGCLIEVVMKQYLDLKEGDLIEAQTTSTNHFRSASGEIFQIVYPPKYSPNDCRVTDGTRAIFLKYNQFAAQNQIEQEISVWTHEFGIVSALESGWKKI